MDLTAGTRARRADTDVELDAVEANRTREAMVALERANELLRARLRETERYRRQAASARERELEQLRTQVAGSGRELAKVRRQLEHMREHWQRDVAAAETHMAAIERDNENHRVTMEEQRGEITRLSEQLVATRDIAKAARHALLAQQDRHGEHIDEARRQHGVALLEQKERHAADIATLEQNWIDRQAVIEAEAAHQLAMRATEHDKAIAHVQQQNEEALDAADQRAAAALAVQYALAARHWRG